MQIVNGQTYTFDFAPSGIDLSGPASSIGSDMVSSLIAAGFPISNVNYSDGGTLFGYLSTSSAAIAFQYDGDATDSDSLGNAMANQLNSDFTFSSFTYSGVRAGDVPAPDSATAAVDKAINKTKSALPSFTTLLLIGLAALLAAIGVFGFSSAAGNKVA